MPLAYSFQRAAVAPGSTRPWYSATQRADYREAELAAAPRTLTPAAIAAMTAPSSIQPLLDVAVELESNRLQRATTVALYCSSVPGALTPRDASMSLATLANGRRNPTARYAIADVSLADDSVVFDGDPAAGDELPVAFPDPVLGNEIVLGGDPQSPSASSWQHVASGGAVTTLTPVVGVDANGSGYVWSWPVAAGSVLRSQSAAVAYFAAAGTARDFTVATYLRAVTTGATIRVQLRARFDVGTGSEVLVTAPAVTLPAASAASAMTEVRSTLTLPAAVADRTYATVRFEVLVVSTSSGFSETLDLDAAQLYAGAYRGPLVGLRAVVPTFAPSIELTWTDPRNVNVVEVHGERRAGRITSAAVYVTEDGTTWTYAGSSVGGSRLAVRLSRTFVALGVRVVIEETTSGPGGPVWVVEVDPQYVVDATDDVVSCEATWYRDAAPGQATSPVGNYQAADLTLELDNSTSRYTPGTNAVLDRGHRVELAVGVRYSNRLANPRADLDTTGWTTAGSGVALDRAFLPDAVPTPSRTTFVLSATGGASVSMTSDPIPAAAASSWRYGLWALADGGAATVDVELLAYDAVSTVTVVDGLYTTPTADALAQVGEIAAAATPAGTVAVALRVTLGGAAAKTVRVTDVELVELDGLGALVEVEELVPAGVFYSDPWDAPSDASSVTVSAKDRLGRYAEVPIAEPVGVGVDVATVVRDVALTYYDLDDDQVAISTSSGSYLIPYAYASGASGSYLADLAKATLSTLYVDPVERLTLSPRALVSATPEAELRADNALMRYRKPTDSDLAVAQVKVTASPLTVAADAELWTMPSGGVTIPVGASREFWMPYSAAPAIGGYTTGIAADGAYTVTSARFYADHAVVVIHNDAAGVLTVAAMSVRGTPLVERPLVARRADPASRARVGPRELAVDARLVQTQAQLDTIADALLDAFRAVDSAGRRLLPDIELDALGLVSVDLGDRITVSDPANGVGSDYQPISRTLRFEGGASLLVNVTGRQAPTSPFAIADSSIADDVYVAGY